jgi:hypothetical protein
MTSSVAVGSVLDRKLRHDLLTPTYYRPIWLAVEQYVSPISELQFKNYAMDFSINKMTVSASSCHALLSQSTMRSVSCRVENETI